MTPKAAIMYAVETLLLRSLSKLRYLHCCSKYNNFPITMPAYDHAVITRSLLYDCQLQGENVFLHESLATCPSQDKVNRKLYSQPIWHLFIKYKRPFLRSYILTDLESRFLYTFYTSFILTRL